MTLADLQSNISISAQNAVTGDIEFCTGYTGFSDNIGEQAGWYLALKVSTSAEGSALEGATITATYAGTVRTLEDGETFIVRLAEGEDSITFTANKEGYTEGRLTLDFSGLDKEALTQNILYTASLTNGVSVSPLQFGESKTITGQVPWNTTDNANTFNISMRPFEMVAPGTPWSIAFNGVELAEGTFSTITPVSGSPYSFAGAKLAVTAEMISAQSPHLVVTVRPDSGDPLDAFYSSMNIGELTLEEDPRPKVNITSDTTNVTISPSSYATSKTATGQVPYDTTAQGNVLSVALTTSGTLPTGPYTIEVFAQGDVMQQPLWYVAGASTIPQSIPIPLISSNVGTGKYITVNTSGANDPEFSIITINTSALTLEAAPTPPTPSTPDFNFVGFEEGEGWQIYNLRNDNDQTTHNINGDDACTLDITYVSQETVSGHTQYNYSMADDGELFLGMKIWSYTPYGLYIANTYSDASHTAILSRQSNINTVSQTSLTTTGEFLSGTMANSVAAFGQNTNAFVCFYCDFSNENTYHYLATNSTNISQNTLVDISSAWSMCFVLVGATAQNIPQNNLVFKLYNSDGSDYVIINIDMSNVSSITAWQS